MGLQVGFCESIGTCMQTRDEESLLKGELSANEYKARTYSRGLGILAGFLVLEVGHQLFGFLAWLSTETAAAGGAAAAGAGICEQSAEDLSSSALAETSSSGLEAAEATLVDSTPGLQFAETIPGATAIRPPTPALVDEAWAFWDQRFNELNAAYRADLSQFQNTQYFEQATQETIQRFGFAPWDLIP